MPAAEFLIGGGTMGEAIRAFDWSTTPLGPPAGWPLSLKNAVRLMLSSRYPMFVWWGPERTKLYNDAYTSILGGLHPEALGRPAQETLIGIWDTISEQVEAVYSGASIWFADQFILTHRNGYPEETYFTYAYSPLRDDEGRIAGLFCAGTEETPKILAQRRMALLQDVASKLAGVCVPDEVYQVLEGGTERPNDLPFIACYLLDDECEHATRVTTSQNFADSPLAPESFSVGSADAPWDLDSLPHDSSTIVFADIPQGFGAPPCEPWNKATSRVALMPLQRRDAHGAGGFLVAGLNPYRPIDEEYRSFLNIFLGQINAALINAQAQDEERRRANELLAIMAHELRNPLAPIRYSAEVLRLGASRDSVDQDALDVIDRQVDHLARLVDDLFDVSRITRGEIDLSRRPISLTAILERSVDASRPLIEAREHQLEVSIADLELTLEADEIRMVQVFSNLLNNAAHYTDVGGHIVVTATRQGDDARISIRDNGLGIAAAQQGRVFDLFARAGATSSHRPGGLGVGLTLVRSLIELHGGRVELKSGGSGAGSEVIVHLPLATDPPEPSATVEATRQQNPVSVLVVDDNHDSANSLAKLLGIIGAQPQVAYDGPSALEALSQRVPDTVMLDLGMPGMDGFEVARRIRQRPELDKVKLIAITGWGHDVDRQRTREVGFDFHLTKPANLQLLKKALHAPFPTDDH